MNNYIVQKIKIVRKDRGLTQQDLAKHLGKTAAAISELERGKVQVSAVDLFEIAMLLNKPIEFFYRESYVGEDAQDLIAIIRKMPEDLQKEMLPALKLLVRVHEIGARAKNANNEQELKQIAEEFYRFAIPYVDSINKLVVQGKEIQAKFTSLLIMTEPEDTVTKD